MSSPIISIIMPMYCIENYISLAIESVLQQTYQDWELLVINDGSTDKSRDIAKKYESLDNRIKILDKKNGGLSDARNYGLKYAKGDYIHFFDGDDIIAPDYYESLSKLMIHNPDIIISGYTIDYEHNNKERNCSIVRNDFNYNKEDAYSIFVFIQLYLNYAWNKLFRKVFLHSNHLAFEKGLYSIEDAEFISRVLSFSPTIIYSNNIGYHYINRERNSLGRMFNQELIELSARRISYEINSFKYINSIIYNCDIYYPVINIYKSLFHALFFFTQKKNFQNYLKTIHLITGDKRLNYYLINSRTTGIVNSFLRFIITNRFDFIIFLIYKYQYLYYKVKR